LTNKEDIYGKCLEFQQIKGLFSLLIFLGTHGVCGICPDVEFAPVEGFLSFSSESLACLKASQEAASLL